MRASALIMTRDVRRNGFCNFDAVAVFTYLVFCELYALSLTDPIKQIIVVVACSAALSIADRYERNH